jgi:hypothetical protein
MSKGVKLVQTETQMDAQSPSDDVIKLFEQKWKETEEKAKKPEPKARKPVRGTKQEKIRSKIPSSDDEGQSDNEEQSDEGDGM